MSNLHIQDIFSHFQDYQTRYLEILNDPEQYYQPVDNAHIHFALLSQEKIYLGDLLQLWFGDKWTEHQVKILNDTDHGFWEHASECWHNSLFVFAIENKGVFSRKMAYAWSTEEQKVTQIHLNHVLPYYCQFLGLERPKRLS